MTTFSPFVSARGLSVSGNTIIRVEDEAGPFLRALAKGFPREFNRALKSLGYQLRNEFGRAMRSDGGSIGQRWDDRSLVSRYRPFAVMARDRWKKRWKHDATHKAGSLALALGSASPMLRSGVRVGRLSGFGSGKLHGKGAVVYKHDPDKMQVQVGFLGTSAPYARMLQAGELGEWRKWPFKGRQPVTPAMRRMFWAAGVPISKSTTFIGANPKPLVTPLFERKRGFIIRYMETRVRAYTENLSGEAAGQFVYDSMRG